MSRYIMGYVKWVSAQADGKTMVIYDQNGMKIFEIDLVPYLDSWEIDKDAEKQVKDILSWRGIKIPDNAIIFTNGPEFISHFSGEAYKDIELKIASFCADVLGTKTRIAHNPQKAKDFIDELNRIGKEGKLRDKFLVLNVCGEEYASAELAHKLVKNYHATGVIFYRSLIHLEAASFMMEELRKGIQEPASFINRKMDEAVEDAIQKAIDKAPANLKPKIQRLDKPFKQYSMRSDVSLKEAA